MPLCRFTTFQLQKKLQRRLSVHSAAGPVVLQAASVHQSLVHPQCQQTAAQSDVDGGIQSFPGGGRMTTALSFVGVPIFSLSVH